MIRKLKIWYYRQVVAGLCSELLRATSILHIDLIMDDLRQARAKLRNLL